ncbi:MAG: enoyl-CoA hydratase/isomerase family protein [Vicinamibacterales bacterium]|mgnify:CR=1 FL=1
MTREIALETLQVTIAEGAATLTLQRPAKRNALNLAMCHDLVTAASALGGDDSVRVVLVRAAGPVFCAGADLEERRSMDVSAVRARRLAAFDAYHALEALPIPVVAIVCGPAVGSGCEIAAACDFVVATPDASFRTPEALWGTVGATQRLPRVLGARLAKDLMFTGRTLSAAEALTAGLVTRLVSSTDLEHELGVMVATIVGASPAALAAAKRCLDAPLAAARREALVAEIAAIDGLLADPETRAGVTSLGAHRSR